PQEYGVGPAGGWADVCGWEGRLGGDGLRDVVELGPGSVQVFEGSDGRDHLRQLRHCPRLLVRASVVCAPMILRLCAQVQQERGGFPPAGTTSPDAREFADGEDHIGGDLEVFSNAQGQVEAGAVLSALY